MDRQFDQTPHKKDATDFTSVLTSQPALTSRAITNGSEHIFKRSSEMHIRSIFSLSSLLIRIALIIIIIISIFKEDNVFSITASLPYGPPVNTNIDYYRTFFRTCLFLQVLRG